MKAESLTVRCHVGLPVVNENIINKKLLKKKHVFGRMETDCEKVETEAYGFRRKRDMINCLHGKFDYFGGRK